MKLKIIKGVREEIHIFGAVEYAEEEPISALWFAWELGKNKIGAVYYGIKGSPKEVDLTVTVGGEAGKDSLGEIIEQIKVMLKNPSIRGQG